MITRQFITHNKNHRYKRCNIVCTLRTILMFIDTDKMISKFNVQRYKACLHRVTHYATQVDLF